MDWRKYIKLGVIIELLICIVSLLLLLPDCENPFKKNGTYSIRFTMLAEKALKNGPTYDRRPYVYEKEVTGIRFREKGIIKNADMAIAIAQTIWKPLGEDEYVPYEVGLIGDSVWVVRGQQLDAFNGDSVYIEIKKSDGKIVRVIKK